MTTHGDIIDCFHDNPLYRLRILTHWHAPAHPIDICRESYATGMSVVLLP